MKPIQVIFGHGLGDCVNFCSQIPLYRRRGYDVGVFCPGNKRLLFKASGARLLTSKTGLRRVGWKHCPGFLGKGVSSATGGRRIPEFNKAGHNLSVDPMPDIGTPRELWDEYISVRIPLLASVGPGAWAQVSRYLQKMPRPIILAHTIGTSFRRAKNLTPEVTHELFGTLLEEGAGSIICLDKEDPVKRTELPNVHYWQAACVNHDLRTLTALQALSDVLIGVDSGPFHLCRLSGLPSLGIFPTSGHHPAKYCLPCDHQASLVPSNDLPWFHDQARALFPIIEEKQLDAATIARHALRLLSEPVYLPQNQRGWDLQLQHWIDKQRTGSSTPGHSS